MALRSSVASSNLVGGVPKKVQGAGVGKGMATRSAVPRAVLGNLSNKTAVSISTKTQKGKAGEKAVAKKKAVGVVPKRSSASSQAVSVRHKGSAIAGVPAMLEKPLDSALDESVQPRNQEVIPEEEIILVGDESCIDVALTPSAPMDVSDASENEAAFSGQVYALTLRDIDEEDAGNPQLVGEYAKDIYRYMTDLENEMPVRKNHLLGQPEINGRMRAILVDWLVQVHQKFRLLQETLFLAIAILDRYLQLEVVAKTKLQLVGVTAMWIASKYEEMYAPEVSDFAYITDRAYTKVEICEMECVVLRALDFSLGRPLPIHFLRRFSKASDVDSRVHNLAKYFMELAMVPCEMAHLKPSFLAAASLHLSQKLLGDYTWGSLMTFYSGYEEMCLSPLMSKLSRLALSAGTAHTAAVKAKYQSGKLMKVSLLKELGSDTLKEIAAWPTSPIFAE